MFRFERYCFDMNTATQGKKDVPGLSHANTSEQMKAGRNKNTARKLHGKYPKTDMRHWLKRVRKEDSTDYGVQILFGGERHRVPLKTPNKEVAADKAAAIYLRLVHDKGWGNVLADYRPGTTAPAKGSTVGDLIRAVSELAEVRPRTLSDNVATFRRIVADIEGIEASTSRFARNGAGREAWLCAVDAVPLANVTPERIQGWKMAFVKRRSKGGETKARAARNSANSMLRAAKSLFAKSLLGFVEKQIVLPSPLPFEGVTPFPRQSMRYESTMDVKALALAASTELAAVDREAYKAFLLSLFGGLRRNECDKLRWSSIDFEKRVIRVESQEDFAPKAETSLGEVLIEPEIAEDLKTLRSQDLEATYVLRGEPVRYNATWATYRAEATFKRLVTWLRAHDIKTRTPLHTLRKEAGSLVYKGGDLLAASRFLRHADTAVTAQHYVSTNGNPTTVGLGYLLRKNPSALAVDKVDPRAAKDEDKKL